ncbi:MAG: hypothetical protein Q9170_002698 [Blastenia crenularia]
MECGYFERPSTSPLPSDRRAEDTHRNSQYVGSQSPRDSVGRESPCAIHPRPRGGVTDTELAKHYLTHTLRTFAEGGLCDDESDTWQIFIPAMALTCPVVRQGMLALAAMCLHYESSPDPSGQHPAEYLEAAESHGKIFVEESRQKLQDLQEGLDTQDHNSVLACSRLLCLLGFAFLRTHRQNGTKLADPAAWTWLHLLRGVKTSYNTVVAAGRPVDETFMRDVTPQLCCRQLTPRISVGHKSPCFHYVQQSQRGFIDALRATLHADWSFLGTQETTDLGAAIDLLSQVTEQVCSQQSRRLLRTICIWPSNVPRGFVDMLVCRFPPALAVYSHWLMLMVLVEDLWWVGNMGRAGIREIIAICSDADRSVRSLLLWPQQMLDVGPKSADTVP